ncbi:MAG TPA: DMT family transporter [Chloroflexia bacterium]|nr:DMT family transporter [Chloroflexia bacterium]
MTTIAQTAPSEDKSSTPSNALAAPTVATQQGLTIYDLLLLGMVTVWAANPAAIKWALQYMDPLVFNAFRFLLAALVPVVVLLLSGERLTWHKGDGWKLLALGLGAHGIYQALFIIGVDNTLAGNTALILSTSPAFVAIFSALLGYERVRGYALAGICLSLLGAALVITGSGKPLELGAQLVGDLLILVVTAIWGFYTTISQDFLKRYSAVKLNALVMPVGAAALFAFSSPQIVSTAPTWTTAPVGAWLVLAASGIFAVSVSYIIWYKGIQKLGTTRTAVYSNLVPVIAATISFFVLKEPLGWQFWAGMVLVLLGVSLARFGGHLRAKLSRRI